MKTLALVKVLFPPVFVVFLAMLLPAISKSQDRRLLIVSSRVGSKIDSVGRQTYNLFGTVNDFESASIYEAPDATFWVWILMRSPEGNLRDAVFEISYQSLARLSEGIDHYEGVVAHTYDPGSELPRIYYADGSGVVRPPNAPAQALEKPQRMPYEYLLLAHNTKGLRRPMFHTTHLDISIGVSTGNFSALSHFIGQKSGSYAPLGMNIDVPFNESPDLSFLGGWSFALGGGGGGDLTQFSAFVVYRSVSFASFNPIIGIGATETWYNTNVDSGDYRIDFSGSLVAPTVLLGFEPVPGMVDVLLAVPLISRLTTTFDDKSYSIEPFTMRLNLVISF